MKEKGSFRTAIGVLAVLIVLLGTAGATQASVLTYEVWGALDFPSDQVIFFGTFSYDTEAFDELIQENAGRFRLSEWDLTVAINDSHTFAFLSEAGGSATLTQGVNPTQLIFEDGSFNQFGLNIDFVGEDLNVAPSIPSGTAVTYGFIEGDVPPSVNDQVVVTLGSPTVNAVLDPPSWCPDPVFDDEGFFPCPCPPCMAPCQFPAEPQGECKGPDGSVSESSFTCCCCGGSENLFRPFTPYLSVDADGLGSMLYWTDIPGAEMFDVVRGDLDLLRSAGGSFTQATTGCEDDSNPGTSLFVDTTPPVGGCVFFLIRGDGGGTYDAASGSQTDPRDPQIAASGNDCS